MGISAFEAYRFDPPDTGRGEEMVAGQFLFRAHRTCALFGSGLLPLYVTPYPTEIRRAVLRPLCRPAAGILFVSAKDKGSCSSKSSNHLGHSFEILSDLLNVCMPTTRARTEDCENDLLLVVVRDVVGTPDVVPP